VPYRVTVVEMAYFSGSTSTGNIDIGIYNETGTRLVSSGSTAKASNGYPTVGVTDTVIGPGLFYFALNNDTTTDTFSTFSIAAPIPAATGVLSETLGSVVLPATATWVQDQTLAFIPDVVAYLVTEM
jgi:hypothetical protein